MKKCRRITDEELMTAPSKHTIIIVKNMWKAAKTVVCDNIGVIITGFSDSPAVEAQGLVGRICGHKKPRDIRVVASYSIDTYQILMDDGLSV